MVSTYITVQIGNTRNSCTTNSAGNHHGIAITIINNKELGTRRRAKYSSCYNSASRRRIKGRASSNGGYFVELGCAVKGHKN